MFSKIFKNKWVIRIASIVIVLVFAVFIAVQMFTKEESRTGENILEIHVFDLGYGTEWVNKAAEKFMEENEGVEIDVKILYNSIETMLLAGPEITTADILMGECTTHQRFVRETLDDGSPILADLTDLYDEVVDGETKTIKQRLYKSVEESFNYCGTDRYYGFPIINDVNGLYYNIGMFRDSGWSVPRTTNELIGLATTIASKVPTAKKNKEVYPFIWFPGYWNYCLPVWWAQYEGLETYLNYFHPSQNIRPTSENSEYKKQLGNKYALEVLNDIVNPSLHTNFSYPGCISALFTDIQTNFLLGTAAMIPNGGWMENEMKEESENADFGIMKMPVISELGVKLGITESELCSIISYIDGDTNTEPDFTSTNSLTKEQVMQAVIDARSLNSMSVSYAYPALVPAYSDAIPLAKKFLAYMTSSEARKIIFKNSGILPCSTSENDLTASRLDSTFSKSKLALYNVSNYQTVPMVNMSDPFYFVPNLMAYSKNTYPAKIFGAKNPDDRMTVDEFLQKEIQYLEENWDYTWAYVNSHMSKPISVS